MIAALALKGRAKCIFTGETNMNPLGKVESLFNVLRVSGVRGLLGKLRSKFGRWIPASEKSVWRGGVTSEVNFWDEFLRTRGQNWTANMSDHYLNPELPLQDEVVELLPTRQGDLQILDVGAGPLTFLGKKCADINFTIVAVDPLADEYDRLLAKYSVAPIVRTEKLDAETLTTRFAHNSFDLVYARNCIDHAYSPEEAVLQMVAVVKPGHYVLMKHFPNEAESENYAGLHQWNFSEEAGDFIIRSRKTKVNVTEKYRSQCTIDCYCDPKQEWLITKIKKI
jgi:SAM-dependent methyltransferase